MGQRTRATDDGARPRRGPTTRAVLAVALLLVVGGCDDGGTGPQVATPAPDASSPSATDATTVPEAGGDPSSDATDERGPDADGWRLIDAAPVAAPTTWTTVAGVWADDRFLLLGTPDAGGAGRVELLALDPASGAWTTMAPLEADVSRWGAQARWADGRLLLLARPEGVDAEGRRPLRLHLWDPADDEWTAARTPPLGERSGHSATWTGDALVVFGGLVEVAADDGSRRNETLADGARWDPVADAWSPLGEFPHEGRSAHGAVWNGRRLVVFGGGHASGRFEAEGEYPWDGDAAGAAAWDPATNAWTSIAGPDGVGPVVASTWTGEHVVWWNGATERMDVGARGAGGVWTTDTGTVEPLAPPPLDLRRDAADAVWAPELGAWLTWGGACGEGCNQNADDGAAWDAATNSWTLLPTAGLGRRHAPIAWTGEELLVVGGSVADQEQQVFESRVDGARWRP